MAGTIIPAAVGQFEDTKCVPISWSARQRTAFSRRYWLSDELMMSVQRRSSGLNFLRCGPRHTIRALNSDNSISLLYNRQSKNRHVIREITSVTDRQTDRSRYSVGNNRPHLRT